MNLNQAWWHGLTMLLNHGIETKPRGKVTLELPQRTFEVDMRQPVLTIADRALSYQFMVAEAFWILSGDDKVKGIAPWNKRISDFSDDGERFFGAYGPRINEQLGYVVGKLISDPSTRQAGLTIWKENPPETKDYPCTVAIWFMRRPCQHGGVDKLNSHVFMRSSDIWLGLPYDVFNFSMLAHLVCARVNQMTRRTRLSTDLVDVEPGDLYLTVASSHIYEADIDNAFKITAGGIDQNDIAIRRTPHRYTYDENALMLDLSALRNSKKGDAARWWEKPV